MHSWTKALTKHHQYLRVWEVWEDGRNDQAAKVKLNFPYAENTFLWTGTHKWSRRRGRPKSTWRRSVALEKTYGRRWKLRQWTKSDDGFLCIRYPPKTIKVRVMNNWGEYILLMQFLSNPWLVLKRFAFGSKRSSVQFRNFNFFNFLTD